jgi:hypothetical protein
MSKDVGVGENGAKAQDVQEYSLTHPKAKLWNKCLWVGGSCWGKQIEFKLVDKTWACKKNSSCKFSQSIARKRLSRIHVFLCLIVPSRGGKMRHHWVSRRSKYQVATLYRSYTNLSNGKQNATCTSHRRTVRMWLYKQGQQRPKWKEPSTYNVETQV